MISQCRTSILARLVFVSCLLVSGTIDGVTVAQTQDTSSNPVLDWNQAFIDTLVATATKNAASQRLGAIVHTSIFDAYNGIDRRYTHVLVPFVDANGQNLAPNGASRRAAVIAAAYTALTELFPSRVGPLTDLYTASLAALSDDGEDGGQSRERGIAWGTYVASTVLAQRLTDGYNGTYQPFTGGPAVGQWRPIAPDTVMTGLPLAYTEPFVLHSNTQFRPDSPRPFDSTYLDDFAAVMALGRKTGSSRTEDQTKLAPFWEGNASVHWNQAANQIARAHNMSMSDSNRLLAALNLSMADTAFTVWKAKLDFGSSPADVTWRPFTAITLADTDPLAETASDPDWLPLVATPSHPEYPAGHPAQNGAAATILLSQFPDAQVFTLTTGTLPSVTYGSISQARADGDNARVWGGMHYPSTVAASDALGAAIADYVNSQAMQPLRLQ